MTKTRMTAAQALARFLIQQKSEIHGELQPLCAGGFAIFGHGNVAGLGEALYHYRKQLPLWRAHNEQAMAHSAIAYAKSVNRSRFMFCTSSIGPGAANMVTAAALAHVNRLPLLLLPGDVFASRNPDPVLQQVEFFQDATISVNDCFKPVSRYFDRITRPEQLIDSLPKAMQVLTDPAQCGPVTISLPQDVQTLAYDYPETFFQQREYTQQRMGSDEDVFANMVQLIRASKKPLAIIGGGVLYSHASRQLVELLDATGIPACETQAGKSALSWQHQCNMGAIGVTGSTAANALAEEADLIIALGSRLQDFTSGSRGLFSHAQLLHINVNAYDGSKHNGMAVTADVGRTMKELLPALSGWQVTEQWKEKSRSLAKQWNNTVDTVTSVQKEQKHKLTDAQVVGIINRSGKDSDIVVCAAGSLPAELHKHWRASQPNGYHVEYGFSCMGYEIAGGMGVRMAHPHREVIVVVGDGSYLMLNSELHASVMQGIKMIVVVLDNHGFGCINRLQLGTGNIGFNNLWKDSQHLHHEQDIDFAAHAASMGCRSQRVASESELQAALQTARQSDRTYIIEIKTDPEPTTAEGGCWWEVAIPEVSERKAMPKILEEYKKNKQTRQRDS